MSDFETEEQQLEELKKWWRDNHKIVIVGTLLGFAAVFGYRGWQGYQESQRQAASQIYSELGNALKENRTQSVLQIGGTLVSKYPRSNYAALAALAMARVYVDGNDLGAAHAKLQWVVDNCDQPDIEITARLRLARVLVAEGKPNLAVPLLTEIKTDAFRAVLQETLGDVYHAMHQPQQARQAYTAALQALQPEDNRTLLQMKLDNLGS
ncbi:MAG: tetratricopeptide repeat protein [Gammaproteobacteria bacterium]|nr:tetratricopeptide repeat protein [Gammaproteobacteria bacterium]